MHHFHLFTLDDDDEVDDSDVQHLSASTVCTSVRNMVAQWVQCETSSGPRIPAGSEPIVCAMAESDLLWLADERPDDLTSLFRDLSLRHAIPLILADSVASVSTDLSLNDFPVQPIFLHQAIGPRKLMRSIVEANDINAYVGSISSPASATPRVLRDYNSGSNGTQGEGAHFPWHGRAAISVQGKAASESTEDQAPAGSPALPEKDEASSERSTVLLVEDNEINMKLLVALMNKSNLDYECAGDGLQALNLYTATPSKFGLILMDITMPVMDGFTSAARIRDLERKKRLPRCKIVALTGVTSTESRESATRVGIDHYFTKPIRMKDVSALVADLRR